MSSLSESNNSLPTSTSPSSPLELSFQQAYRRLERDISRKLAHDDKEQSEHDQTVNNLMAKISGSEQSLHEKSANDSKTFEHKLEEMIRRADADSEIRRREYERRMEGQRQNLEIERRERERLEAKRREMEESIERRKNKEWDWHRNREREALRSAEKAVAKSSMSLFVSPYTTASEELLDRDSGLEERYKLAREIEKLKEEREVLELQRARQRMEMRKEKDEEKEKEQLWREIKDLQSERMKFLEAKMGGI